jgi:hypothetical protein
MRFVESDKYDSFPYLLSFQILLPLVITEIFREMESFVSNSCRRV